MTSHAGTTSEVSTGEVSQKKTWYKILYIQVLIAILLGAIFGWLAFGMKLGVEKAWLVGVVPFIAGSLIKNALGAALVPAIRRLVDRRS